MRAEEHKGVAESLFVGDGEISALLRTHDWSQTPLGDIDTWSDSLKTAVQILLTELDQVNQQKKTQIEPAFPPQHCTQTATLRQSAEADAFGVALTNALHPLTDANEIQATAARILGEYLGASRVIYIEVLPNGDEIIVHKNYTNGVAELSGLFHLENFGYNLTEDHRAGRTAIVSDVANSPKYTESEKERYRTVNVAAYIVVPLIKNHQFVVLLAVHQATPRQWTDNEVRWAEETAERTWAAVERARAEAALRESEEKSRNILESIAEAFFALDQDWRFTYMNQSGEALLDRPPGDLIGKNIWEEYPGLAGSEFETIYRGAMRDAYGGRSHRVRGTLTAFYPDHDRWYDVRTYPAANGIAVYFNNVTAQIQAEESSRLSEARFRRIFDSKMIGMGIWTRSGEIIDANDALLNLIGYTRQDLESGLLTWQELTPPEQHWLDEQAIAQIAMSGTCPNYEKEYIHKQGQRIPILVGAGAFADTTDTGVFFTINLTERKAAEAERENLLQQEQAARAAAELANRVKDEFLAVLSHELRSPLNPILGWVRLMRSGKLDPARQTEALATIERNAKLQSQLIEDLLDISRIMRGKLALTAAPVSLAFVISAAAETVSLAAEAKNIQITLDLDPKIAPIFGDAARLQQVVWNLLTNAVKFTANGGQMTVELRLVESEGSKVGNQMAQIQVIDTGKGISPQFLPHVFEYFRQEDGSTTRRFGGLGLGLAIVRQIVELHGGTVKAESQGEDQGATFIVQLPILQQAIPLVPEPIYTQANSETLLKTIQVLLVDDDTDTREFQAFLLEQNGAKVIAAASGLEALQALEQFIPDVIVSDIGMAQMDGYMLMQQIRSRLPHQGGMIPAIALTAYAAEIDQKRAMQAGFQRHLTKPLEPEQFVSAIVSLLKPNRV